jgi:hypothetical protein
MRNYTATITDSNERVVEITGTVTPGSPGCTYGPPENCYEAEAPEVEVTSGVYLDDLGHPVCPLSTDELDALDYEACYEALVQTASDEADEAREDDCGDGCDLAGWDY